MKKQQITHLLKLVEDFYADHRETQVKTKHLYQTKYLANG